MTTVSVSPATKLPCPHTPECPAADAPDHDAAKVVDNHHADAGYVRLCNGVYLFDDTGELQPSLPSGALLAVGPHRPAVPHRDGRAWSQTAVI